MKLICLCFSPLDFCFLKMKTPALILCSSAQSVYFSRKMYKSLMSHDMRIFSVDVYSFEFLCFPFFVSSVVSEDG
jgi:hypothetical protein